MLTTALNQQHKTDCFCAIIYHNLHKKGEKTAKNLNFLQIEVKLSIILIFYKRLKSMLNAGRTAQDTSDRLSSVPSVDTVMAIVSSQNGSS